VLPINEIVCTLLNQFYTINVGAGTVCLHHIHHVDTSHVVAGHCHDVTHVGVVHGDAVVIVIEVIEHKQQQVHPLLGGDGDVICFVQFL
jgi:hypothetical protein